MRLNAGLPVWHASVSLRHPRRGKLDSPREAELYAIKTIAGVGGDREWWIWNPDARVGHLRVGLTADEADVLPPGLAVHDAGDSGPERPRTIL